MFGVCFLVLALVCARGGGAQLCISTPATPHWVPHCARASPFVLGAVQGFDLQRTVLVDNDDYKAADGEHENMLHVPHWEQTAGEGDRAGACGSWVCL